MNNYTKIKESTEVINIVDKFIYIAVESFGKIGKKDCYFARKVL